MTRWSESSEDIRALRKMVRGRPDGASPRNPARWCPLRCPGRPVLNDDAGNVRLQKQADV